MRKGRKGEGGLWLRVGREGRRRGQGTQKVECGREGGVWEGKKEGRGMEGISLPHGRLKTLAALSKPKVPRVKG